MPKLAPAGPLDGTWHVHRLGPNCRRGRNVRFAIHVANGVVGGRWGGGPISGTVSASGKLAFKHLTSGPRGGNLYYSGTLKGESGAGSFRFPGTRCQGSMTLVRD